jgi:hypothetical protein
LLRLTGRALARNAVPEIYAGLVYAARFCGLASESLTFHYEAKRLDPGVSTSVTQTYFQIGDYLRCLETAGEDLGYIGPAALEALGQREQAIARLRARVQDGVPLKGGWLLVASLLATIEGDRTRTLGLVEQFLEGGYVGAEAQTYIARQLIHLGEHDRGLDQLARAVGEGFHHAGWLERDPWVTRVRSSALDAIVERARYEFERSRAAFAAAGGNQLLARAR